MTSISHKRGDQDPGVRVRQIIAHRAGNDLQVLRQAKADGIRTVEADLRLYRGQVEVRHLHHVGPLPIFWDKWHLANPFKARLRFAELLEELRDSSVQIVLDLKGGNRRLAQMVREALVQSEIDLQRVAICARRHHMLESFQILPNVRLVHSVGTRRGLQRLLKKTRAQGTRLGGVSIHANLLSSATAQQLHLHTDLIMTWPVNTPERAHKLLALGVHQLISDRPVQLLAIKDIR